MSFDPSNMSDTSSWIDILALSRDNLKSLIDYRVNNNLYMSPKLYQILATMNSNKSDPVYGYNPCGEIANRDIQPNMYGWKIEEKKCECGAKFTSRPNYHLDWCPLYEKK